MHSHHPRRGRSRRHCPRKGGCQCARMTFQRRPPRSRRWFPSRPRRRCREIDASHHRKRDLLRGARASVHPRRCRRRPQGRSPWHRPWSRTGARQLAARPRCLRQALALPSQKARSRGTRAQTLQRWRRRRQQQQQPRRRARGPSSPRCPHPEASAAFRAASPFGPHRAARNAPPPRPRARTRLAWRRRVRTCACSATPLPPLSPFR